MAAGKAMHPKLINVWERRKHQWRREVTFRASLSNATVMNLIDDKVANIKLDQWISAKENKVVCGGFGIGCEVVCCRMLSRSEAVFPPH